MKKDPVVFVTHIVDSIQLSRAIWREGLRQT